ncbi:hypothetical protein R3W88_005167 [Solanum pinnatisectum]|uniref:Uncharacterized protein n=1 Tax=Solanum pinnatisectum TaxID=50273 RepID=A0AAV9KBG0_9SOLN|nr:hypothetical protein R3W88_005167 [Solanum pinnatisectum]
MCLSKNQFSGIIPSSFSNLTKLKMLRLQSNFLEGEIPLELGDLHYMTFLDLSFNQLTGSIPSSIYNISRMETIDLTYNNLTGKLPTTIYGIIPPNIKKCRKLQLLSLSENDFTGTIPRKLAHLTALTELYLGGLHLEGTYKSFPRFFFSSKLVFIYFPLLTGEIPAELGNLKKLWYLGLDINNFTGSVPASIFNMSLLQILSLRENRLSGTLPSDLGDGMPSLEELYCGSNNMSGFISASISNSSRLRILDLTFNSFTGPIPESLGNLKYLEFLNLGKNNFVGDSALSFLTSLTKCRKLKAVSFAYNPLDGVFPASVGNFSDSLQSFEGHSCKLKGIIPEEIGNLTKVIKMNLYNNELTGDIPNTVQAC